ncbi:hypothetical protein KIN20_006495 [Parelaphostrongylus tenuis]|uniref:Uncharacterized protein n=1 Tax=Parelaphostrongylus tenuis TaxID=148309 RepID=A0AAD5MU73_PARTN|nr:hypothetical protein KIN20_006495 [Parelaphostrongylus tenuis]
MINDMQPFAGRGLDAFLIKKMKLAIRELVLCHKLRQPRHTFFVFLQLLFMRMADSVNGYVYECPLIQKTVLNE